MTRTKRLTFAAARSIVFGRLSAATGAVEYHRSSGRVTFPAAFRLFALRQPCPCGHLGNPARACICMRSTVDRYRARAASIANRPDVEVVDLTTPANQEGC